MTLMLQYDPEGKTDEQIRGYIKRALRRELERAGGRRVYSILRETMDRLKAMLGSRVDGVGLVIEIDPFTGHREIKVLSPEEADEQNEQRKKIRSELERSGRRDPVYPET